MRVECEVEEDDLEGDHGTVKGVVVTCSRCGHVVESFGTTGRSIRRCLAMLKEECPNGESNYYVADGQDD